MIVAIDGPAGAGKSTTARAVAEHFNFAYIDTGAMYRAVALAAGEARLDAARDIAAVVALAQALPLRIEDNGRRIVIGSRDVSEAIREPGVGRAASAIAAIAEVRAVVVAQQRRLAHVGQSSSGGAVLEGRDIQTVVFPEAEVKIFLTASAPARALRRLAQRQEGTAQLSYEQTLRDIIERDSRDTQRTTSPLCAAPDAHHVCTDDLSTAEVVEVIAKLITSKLKVRHS